MKPGSTLFMRTLSAAYLSANSLVNAARPARNTPEVGNTGSGSNAAKVEMLMIVPPPCFTISGATSRAGRTALSR
jgi:hypothetical protein